MPQTTKKPLNQKQLSHGKRALLSAANRRIIEREAKAVGLSTNEYMRLIIGLASSLRESFGETTKVEGRQLLQLIENPIFIAVLKTVVQSVALSNQEDSNDEDSTTPTPPSERATPPTHQVPRQVLPYGYPPNLYHRIPQQLPTQNSPAQQLPIRQFPNYQVPYYPIPLQQQPTQPRQSS